VRNKESWKPSKYVYRKRHLVASRDERAVGVGSRLMSDLIARGYEHHLPLHARGKLLDLGCGKAPLYATYRDMVTECVCVDWANTEHKNDHLDKECDLTQPLPFADAEFDTIILSDVLEHIPTPEALCREMARTLAPNGKLILNVPFFYWLHEDPHDFYRYTEYALRRFVDISGLKLVSLEAIGGVPEVLTDILAKYWARVPVIGRPVAAFMQWLTLRIVDTRLGRKVSRATARKVPFGYFLVAQKPA